jgi:hypothetical protein
VYSPAVWKVTVPPKIQFFLWLIAHNKILTRDNLVKRQSVDDLVLSVLNLKIASIFFFFECVVAKVVWAELTCLTGLYINNFSFKSLGRMWLCEKKYKVQNTVFAAAMWVLWNTRNDIYFNRSP